MLQNSIHKKRFHSNDENIRAKIDIARNNKIPPVLNTKISGQVQALAGHFLCC
jgi:hypothetical protein